LPRNVIGMTSGRTLDTQTVWQCRHCGKEMDDVRKFCTQCGTNRFISPVRLTECPSCNVTLDPEWDFCGDCGKEVDPAPPATGVRAELNYLQWWLRAWRNWSGSGRSPRVEFWSFLFINAIMMMGLAWMSGITYLSSSVNVSDNMGGAFALEIANTVLGAAIFVLYLAMIIPSVTLFVRRMHDTNRTGWNYLWNLAPLVGWVILLVYLLEGTRTGPNKYEGPMSLK